jgi:hypothetical protein
VCTFVEMASSPFKPEIRITRSHSDESISDAEKGLYDNSMGSLVPPPSFVYMHQKRDLQSNGSLCPMSPIHEGITPLSSVPELTLQRPAGLQRQQPIDASALPAKEDKKPPPPKPKISRWILFDLWFNTYRKFFTFVTLLNLTGIIMAALNRFHYAEDHLGALVLGNLLCAILFRNELFMRCLYVAFIYGLRGVSSISSLL